MSCPFKRVTFSGFVLKSAIAVLITIFFTSNGFEYVCCWRFVILIISIKQEKRFLRFMMSSKLKLTIGFILSYNLFSFVKPYKFSLSKNMIFHSSKKLFFC